jgi:hypothetical protein
MGSNPRQNAGVVQAGIPSLRFNGAIAGADFFTVEVLQGLATPA